MTSTTSSGLSAATSSRTTRAAKGAVAVMVLSSAAVGGSLVASGAPAAAAPEGRQLTGTWAVTVDPDGPPPAFVSTIAYAAGGSVVETTANRPPSAVTAGLGTWERLGEGRFATRIVKYRFDGGAFVGTTVIEETAELAPDGETYTARATTTLYDPAGVVRGTFASTATGERL